MTYPFFLQELGWVPSLFWTETVMTSTGFRTYFDLGSRPKSCLAPNL